MHILSEVFGPIDREDPAKMKQPLDDATLEVNRRQKLHAFSEMPEEEHHHVGEAEFEERRPSKTMDEKIEKAAELPL